MSIAKIRNIFGELLALIFPKFSPNVEEARKEDIRNIINILRLEHMLPPLKLNFELTQIAQNAAKHLSELESLQHAECSCRIVRVFPNGCKKVMLKDVARCWMSTSPYRTYILGTYTILGVGRSKSASGELYLVVDFDG